jgi:hypothetical protein
MQNKYGLLLAGVLLLVSPVGFLAQQLSEEGTTLESPHSVGSPIASAGKFDACHAGNTCPDPKSCGSWSTYANCEAPFCMADETCVTTGIATYQLKERFRTCTLADSSTCTEWELVGVRLFCHC